MKSSSRRFIFNILARLELHIVSNKTIILNSLYFMLFIMMLRTMETFWAPHAFHIS